MNGPPEPDVVAVVLAGGASRRMGRPKAFLRVEGTELLERALRATAPVAAEILVSAGHSAAACVAALQRYGAAAVPPESGLALHGGTGPPVPTFLWRGRLIRIVADRRPGLGPLSGLEATLSRTGHARAWVLACDLPRVPAELGDLLLRRLAERALPGEGRPPAAVVPLVDGRWQPLCGSYETTAGPVAGRCLDRGERRVERFLHHLEVTPIREGELRAVGDPRRVLHNVNRPADLEKRPADLGKRPADLEKRPTDLEPGREVGHHRPEGPWNPDST